MKPFGPLGLGSNFERHGRRDAQEAVVVQRVLRRILSFTGRTIDDVINDPIARNQVTGYFKLHKQSERAGEIRDLERQWNPLG